MRNDLKPKNYLIGVDAGTTSFKAALCGEDGSMIATARREYSLLTNRSMVEFPPESYWSLFCSVVQDLFACSGVSPEDVAALAISSQGETFVCIDAEGNALGNAIVWLDNRAGAECAELQAVFAPSELYLHTGQREVQPTWPATKILWMRKHQPERFAQTQKFLLLEDYLIFRLTGRAVCERALLASTLLYDIPAGRWWKDMLRIVGIGEDRLPEIMDSAAPVGYVTTKAAKQSGLASCTMVVTGALDQIAMMVGSGNIRPGRVAEVTGSCLVVEAVSNRFADYDPARPLTCQPFCIPGSYLLMMFSNTAGMALKWFRDSLYPDGSMTYSSLCAEAAEVGPGAEGLIMLPHLAGAQFPKFNPDAKGVFYGAALSHRRGHFVRAILEAVAYIDRSMLALLERSGIPCSAFITLGGAASSAVWNQIKADVMGRNIQTAGIGETASAGAAAMAGVGCGLLSGFDSACERLARPSEVFLPDPANARLYDGLYARYCGLDEKVTQLQSQAARFYSAISPDNGE
jgi:xylulokinase